jgi:hypothetical protein
VNVALPERASDAPDVRPKVPAWAEALTIYLDRAFVVPGTNIRVGIDPLLGVLAPGAGDAVGALASFAIFYLGFKLRVPKVVLLRMLVNIAVDALVGAVPVLGDLFDVFFRAAERNLALVKRHGGTARAADFSDYAVVALALVVVLGLCLLPLLVGLLLVHFAVHFRSG